MLQTNRIQINGYEKLYQSNGQCAVIVNTSYQKDVLDHRRHPKIDITYVGPLIAANYVLYLTYIAADTIIPDFLKSFISYSSYE